MSRTGTAVSTDAPGGSERHWSTTRRAADLAWVAALVVALAFSPVARWYLLTWPGVVELGLVVVIALGIGARTIAERRLRAIGGTGAAAAAGPTTDAVGTESGSHGAAVVAWTLVVLVLPVVWAGVLVPFVAATSFDWGPTHPSGALEPVVIATFLVCPFLVGVLVWWLARAVRHPPERLLVALVVTCATGVLVYGSLGFAPPLLTALL